MPFRDLEKPDSLEAIDVHYREAAGDLLLFGGEDVDDESGRAS